MLDRSNGAGLSYATLQTDRGISHWGQGVKITNPTAHSTGTLGGTYTVMKLELGSYKSVENFVYNLRAFKGPRPLDRLVCNAAVYLPADPKPRFTEDGYEMTMGVRVMVSKDYVNFGKLIAGVPATAANGFGGSDGYWYQYDLDYSVEGTVNTDTASAAFTTGWTMSFAGDTLLQGTYKICFDEDGGTATLMWADTLLSFQLQKFVTDVDTDLSFGGDGILFAAKNQALYLTSNVAPAALTDDTSTVYLTSGTCDDSSSGSVAAVAGTSTASAVVDDDDDEVATTWIAHIDARDLAPGTYRVCVDADGAASTYNFADTGLTTYVLDSSTPWVWGYDNGANGIRLSDSDTSAKGYLTQGDCSSATNGAHTANAYGTDTSAGLGNKLISFVNWGSRSEEHTSELQSP